MRYNTPNTPIDNIRDFVTRGGIPVTMTLLIANVLTFALAFMSQPLGLFLFKDVAFNPAGWLHSPWTLLTYPFVYLDVTDRGFFNFLFGGFFFWSTAGSLERSWGSMQFAKIFAVLTVISALFLFLGLVVVHELFILYSFFLPMAAIMVAFCALRPEETLSFFFFPVRAKYVAIITAAFTWVFIGQGGQPMLGLFGCASLALAYLYTLYGRTWATQRSSNSRATRRPDLRVYPAASKFSTKSKPQILDGSARRSPLDLAGRWKDYQERRRLEKLWKNSGFSEPEQRWQDDDRRR